MGKEKKTTENSKIRKKGSFTQEELDEIELAMEEEGYSSFSAYTMHMVRTRREKTDAEQRRKQMCNYRHAKIQTLHNKLMANIDVKNTVDGIMREVDALCQDLV